MPVVTNSRELDPLRDRVPAAIARLAAAIGRMSAYAAGERVFGAGERVAGLHLVVSGAIRIIREGPGRAVVVHREGPGGLLGEVALFGDGTYPATALAAEPSRVALLPAREVIASLRTDVALAEVFLERLANRTREIIGRLDRLAHQSVLRRLAGHLAARHAASSGTRDALSLGMTQTELADELGTVKEVVVRELRALRRLRLIEPRGRGLYTIKDIEGLRALAGE